MKNVNNSFWRWKAAAAAHIWFGNICLLGLLSPVDLILKNIFHLILTNAQAFHLALPQVGLMLLLDHLPARFIFWKCHRCVGTLSYNHLFILLKIISWLGIPRWKPSPWFVPDTIPTGNSNCFTQVQKNICFIRFNVFSGTLLLYPPSPPSSPWRSANTTLPKVLARNMRSNSCVNSKREMFIFQLHPTRLMSKEAEAYSSVTCTLRNRKEFKSKTISTLFCKNGLNWKRSQKGPVGLVWQKPNPLPTLILNGRWKHAERQTVWSSLSVRVKMMNNLYEKVTREWSGITLIWEPN